MDACARRYGPVFTLTADQVHVRLPELVRHVLRSENEFVLAPTPVTTERTSIQIDHPDRWKLARRLIWDGVNPASCAAAAPHLAQRWHEHFARPIRFRDVERVMLATAAVQWPLMLREAADRPELGRLLVATIRQRQRSGVRINAWTNFRLRKMFDKAMAAVLDTIAQRRAQHEKAAIPDVLDALLADESGSLSDIDIAQSLGVCLDAAMTTTGSAACWTLVALADCDAATLRELRDPERADAFVSEVLRHTPAIEALNRIVATDTMIGDYRVRKGDNVLLDVAALHHDPTLWDQDPQQFCPARWQSDRPHVPGAYLPFGAGPRFCLGSRIATVTLTTLVQTIADGYTVTGTKPRRCRRDNLNWPDPFRIEITPRGDRP